MPKRNYGIDLLRLLAMLYVIILHTLGAGGILDHASPDSGTYAAAWYLEIFAYCAVDIFALISGYVSYNEPTRKTHLSSYIMLWLQVVFCSVAAALVCHLVRPDLVSLRSVADMIFPVKNGLYWYFTAYTGLFVVKPLLDAAITACSNDTARKTFVAIILVFCCFDWFLPHFYTHSGYCFVWLVLLYILGAILKKCEMGQWITFWGGMAGIFVLCTITWIHKLSENTPSLVSYASPTIVGTAILYVIAFSKIKPGNRIQKVIAFAAPGAFSAYILNCQRDVWTYVIKNRFVFLTDKPIVAMLLFAVSFSLLFLVASVLFDKMRQMLFKLLHIKNAAVAVEGIADTCVRFVAEKL